MSEPTNITRYPLEGSEGSVTFTSIKDFFNSFAKDVDIETVTGIYIDPMFVEIAVMLDDEDGNPMVNEDGTAAYDTIMYEVVFDQKGDNEA